MKKEMEKLSQEIIDLIGNDKDALVIAIDKDNDVLGLLNGSSERVASALFSSIMTGENDMDDSLKRILVDVTANLMVNDKDFSHQLHNTISIARQMQINEQSLS